MGVFALFLLCRAIILLKYSESVCNHEGRSTIACSSTRSLRFHGLPEFCEAMRAEIGLHCTDKNS
jgi:hypothetical protein